MKIVFTGGGTGGHFYPIIAIAEALNDIVVERHLVAPKLYYLSDKPYDEDALFENNIVFRKTPAGKVRRYFSFQNFTDIFRTAAGIITCYFILLRIYPDVVVSKGGYASVPTVIAAHFLRLPIIIHESDAEPGRANLLAANMATRIAIAFESSVPFFPLKSRHKIARTGIPIRKGLTAVEREGARELLGLDTNVPTLLILGGSLGSTRINEIVLDCLPDLVSFANIIHQTGKAHYDGVRSTSAVVLEGNAHAGRYHPYPYLNTESIRRAAGACDVVISRAGATAITEISLWKKPAILIPIPESVSHDQRANAYAYAHTGAAVVLEENNMTPHVFASEARRLATDRATASIMSEHAAGFANPKAASLIANELVKISLSHEPIN